MQTLQPVLLHGRYEWKRDELFAAEFQARLQAVRQVMYRSAWDALVVHGDSRENAALCYLTNVVPNQRAALALIGAEDLLQVVACVGPRDLPAVTRLTWVEDVRAARDVKTPLFQWLTDYYSESNLNCRPARIGVVDLHRMRADVGRDVEQVCRSFGEVEDATEAVSALRQVKSPYELSLLRKSYDILQCALLEVEQRRRSGAAIGAALIAGERSARQCGAQDVRALCSAGGLGYLVPVGQASHLGSAEPWTVYLAVRYCGYWTEAVTTMASSLPAATQAVRSAIDQALASVRPGITGRELYNAIQPRIAAWPAHPMLGRKIARAHGLSLDAEPWITADSDVRLAHNNAYTVMVGLRDDKAGPVMESTTVFVGRQVRELLHPLAARLELQ